MRISLAALVLTSLLALPATARAGWIVEASVGKGARLSPSPVRAEPTNVMIAPGFTIPFLRFEVGLVNSLPDVKDRKYDLEVRPMVVVAPPILPLYGRAIFAFANLLHSEQRELAYGAALGLKFGLGPVGVFAEAGVLPRKRKFTDETQMTTRSQMAWILEGRLGATLEF